MYIYLYLEIYVVVFFWASSLYFYDKKSHKNEKKLNFNINWKCDITKENNIILHALYNYIIIIVMLNTDT
jgi:hypothetical protein